MGSLCTQKMLATAPQIARATLGRTTPLAHPNAPSRALYGPGVARQHAPTTTETLHMRASNTPKGIVGFLCTQKVLATAAPARQRAQLSGAHTDRSPIQMRHLVRYTGPEWRAHAHNRRNATRACSQDAETHHGIPLHSNGVCSIETCGTSKLLAEQPTSRPSKPIMLSVTRVVSGVCPPTNARKHAACLLWPRPNASLDPFALKTSAQHTAPPRARASLGRASNLSPIKIHHIERLRL